MAEQKDWRLDPSQFTKRDKSAAFNSDDASQADKIRERHDLEKTFKTEQSLQRALDANAERDELLEDAKNKHNAKVTEFAEGVDPRMWSPEFGKFYNERIQQMRDDRKQAEIKIHDMHKAAYNEIELSQYSTTIGPKDPLGADRQITYQPTPEERTQLGAAWDRAKSGPERSEVKMEWDRAVHQNLGWGRAAPEQGKAIGDDGGRSL